MKRLLFILLILANGIHALPKNTFAKLCAFSGLSGLAWYLSTASTLLYDMKKEHMFTQKIDVPKSSRPIHFDGYHVAVNANNDIYDYKFSLAEVNLWHVAQEIGFANIICTRESAQHPQDCNLAQLHIHKNYRYGGFGSLMLQEAIADLKQRTTAHELDLWARAELGTSQSRLEHFYEKNGGKRKDDPYVQNVFAFNLKDNKI
jgi:GNAT superfamily N-acetyltransferase